MSKIGGWARFASAAVVLMGAAGACAEDPVSQDGLLLRLDASDSASLALDDDRVVSWTSLTQNGTSRCVASASVGHRPKWLPRDAGALRSAIVFDGIDDVLLIPAFGHEADTWTLAMVAAPYSPVKGGGLCSACPKGSHDYDPGFTVDLFQASMAFDQISVEGAGRIGGQQDQLSRAFPCGGLHVIVVIRRPESVNVYVDGQEEGSRPATPARTIMEELRVGARYYAGSEKQYFHGEIAQLALYARAVTDEERARIEQSLRVSDEERTTGERESARAMASEREERMRNRMKAPQLVMSWPNVKAFLAERQPAPVLAAIPVRTDIREAVGLCMQHLNNLYDRDRNDEPFFYANCMADGTGKMFHSVNIGIPHVVGRCLVGCMAGERATGIPFPPEGLAILERYCRASFDNPDHLNSYYDPDKGQARCIEFHNMREGLYGLWALAAGHQSAWARDEAHRMLETLDRLTDEDGRWSPERARQLDAGERCYGIAVPNATRMVDPLLAYHACTGDPLALKLAGLYARQGLQTMFTEDGHFAPMDRSSGHVHSITSSLSGIAAYAVKIHDAAMLDACRRIMDTGVPEYFSSWGWGDEVFPDHPADEVSRGEINQTGDVIRTALMLGDAGLPRYYAMAERYLRSMLLPTQHRAAELHGFLKNKADPADDSERNVLERSVGGFAMQRPNDRMRAGDWPVTTLDITSGAVHALSECYTRRVSVGDGGCTVNLLFDADNDSVSIDSGLPFEGRVSFRAKSALSRFRVCLPPWVDTATVRATLRGKPANATIADGFADLGPVESGDNGSVTFDLPCKTEKETVDGIEYTTTWIGSQIIEILPRGNTSPLPF